MQTIDTERRAHRPTRRIRAWLAALALTLPLAAEAPALTLGEAPGPAASALLEQTLPELGQEGRVRDGGELFRRVMATERFASGSVGPFDVHVFVADRVDNERKANALRDDLVEALEPSAELIKRLWPADDGDEGLISGARLPIVVADGDDAFAQLIELVDYCERVGFSGWAPANAVDTTLNRAAEVVRTWDVQLFNLAHRTIDDRRKEWISRGVGYYSLAFVANRALRRGAWGLVPPWLAHGFIDELDIAAHGRAWVGQSSWERQTPGWYREGWSGFVPKGSSPPPPISGPPADLAVTVKNTGDPWLDFDSSEGRHWTELVADRRTEAPASFQRAAESESFMPRDRAAARCLLHLMLQVAPGEQDFASLLDDPVSTPRDGMPDSEPLPVLFSRALGGVPEVDRLESLSSFDLLKELEREDLLYALKGAEEALKLSDHRKQSLWLSRQTLDQASRVKYFNAFLEIEFAQQMAEWKAIAPHLDHALTETLLATKRYPKRDRDLKKAAGAFREALAEDPAPSQEAKSSKGRSKRSRRR